MHGAEHVLLAEELPVHPGDVAGVAVSSCRDRCPGRRARPSAARSRAGARDGATAGRASCRPASPGRCSGMPSAPTPFRSNGSTIGCSASLVADAVRVRHRRASGRRRAGRCRRGGASGRAGSGARRSCGPSSAIGPVSASKFAQVEVVGREPLVVEVPHDLHARPADRLGSMFGNGSAGDVVLELVRPSARELHLRRVLLGRLLVRLRPLDPLRLDDGDRACPA